MDALYNEGMEDHALKMLTKKDERSWYHMLELGAGMTMEAWDLKFKPNLDWNHAWGAAPSNLIAFGLMGIRPLRPGFTEAVIRPQTGRLKMAEIRLPTILGEVHEKITQDENNYVYELELPPSMKARVELPMFIKDMKSIRITGHQGRPIMLDNKYVLKSVHGSVRVLIKKN
jgi:hypothetical protein